MKKSIYRKSNEEKFNRTESNSLIGVQAFQFMLLWSGSLTNYMKTSCQNAEWWQA